MSGEELEDARAELAEVEHLCRTLDSRARVFVSKLLSLLEQGADELAEVCDRADRAEAEVERLEGEAGQLALDWDRARARADTFEAEGAARGPFARERHLAAMLERIASGDIDDPVRLARRAMAVEAKTAGEDTCPRCSCMYGPDVGDCQALYTGECPRASEGAATPEKDTLCSSTADGGHALRLGPVTIETFPGGELVVGVGEDAWDVEPTATALAEALVRAATPTRQVMLDAVAEAQLLDQYAALGKRGES